MLRVDTLTTSGHVTVKERDTIHPFPPLCLFHGVIIAWTWTGVENKWKEVTIYKSGRKTFENFSDFRDNFQSQMSLQKRDPWKRGKGKINVNERLQRQGTGERKPGLRL